MQYNTADQFHTNIVNIGFKQEREGKGPLLECEMKEIF